MSLSPPPPTRALSALPMTLKRDSSLHSSTIRSRPAPTPRERSPKPVTTPSYPHAWTTASPSSVTVTRRHPSRALPGPKRSTAIGVPPTSTGPPPIAAPVAISMTSAVLSFLATASHPLGASSLMVTTPPSPDCPALQHPLTIPRARDACPHRAFIVKVSFDPSADLPAASALRRSPSSSVAMSRSRLPVAPSSNIFPVPLSIECAERASVRRCPLPRQ
mmetsp:Transcript_4459/g.16740  ORF Transcript_4459/g.16740 Transcript_4459/m.16740 type:complete len:219 (+) Transcript_4459:802-1458(+)